MKMLTEKERIKWCYSFKAGKRWLNALMVDRTGSKHTEREYSRSLFTFCQWIGKNPDQLIAERKTELKNSETEKNTEDKVREFCLWLEKTRDITRTTVATKYHAPLKSFYNYNDVPLKLRTPKHTMRRREPHTTEQIKALMNIGDVRERATMMLLKDSGMSREDAVQVKYGSIKNEFEANKEVVHIKTVRQKEAIQYDTFIGSNAIEHLKAYLNYRRTLGEEITEDSPLIATLGGKPLAPEALSAIFIRLGKKIGFKTSPHRFRKYFESHLGLSVPSIVVKYWMGHSLGVEGSYFLPPLEKQREKYTEAYHEIDIFKKEVSELERRKQVMLDHARLMKWNKEKLELLKNLLARATEEEDLDNIGEQLEREKLEPIDCEKMISESELEEWLAKGFKFVAVLPSGKILVSNET